MSSLKGISPLFDSYLRVKEKPSRYQTDCNYIQGKLSVSKKDTTRMAEPAVSSSQDPDIIPEDDVCQIQCTFLCLEFFNDSCYRSDKTLVLTFFILHTLLKMYFNAVATFKSCQR